MGGGGGKEKCTVGEVPRSDASKYRRNFIRLSHIALFENLKVVSYLLKNTTLKVSIFYEERITGCSSCTLYRDITFPDFVHLFLQEYSTFTVRLVDPGDLIVDYPIITFLKKKN